jgi:ferredoxin-thioredoxin reductase catalytic subunit/rubredoxin
MSDEVSTEEILQLYNKIKSDAENSGYLLNPDKTFTMDLMHGLLVNQKRYGYISCPCRLADGDKEKDLDIVCPCDYRDPDLYEFGSCLCALYVTADVAKGAKKMVQVPERRKTNNEKEVKEVKEGITNGVSINVWRCSVCGYLTARDNPPEKCPICKVSKERFKLFISAS